MSRRSLQPMAMKARTALILMFASVFGWADGGQANLRAPAELVVTPSGALVLKDAPGAASLVVEHEALRLHCALDRCQVQAVYRLDVKAPLVLQTALVLGSGSPVQVSTSTANGAITRETITPRPVTEADALTEPLQRVNDLATHGRSRIKPAAPHLAPLTLNLPAGRAEVSLVYEQPAGWREVGHGYFADGIHVSTVDYHLWPLAGWPRASSFAIDVEVTFTAPERGLWHRLWSADDGIACVVAGGSDEGARGVTVWEDRGRADPRAVLRTRLAGSAVPDLLMCSMGEGVAPAD